jgi:hypothetical protein
MADFGDEIRKYIQEIASASVTFNKKTAEWAANVNKESKTKDAQLQAMMAQIQALTNTVATLSKAIAAAAKQGGGGSRGSSGGVSGSGGNNIGGGGERTFKYTRNMGAYCSTHGHHPVGANHTSATCTHKRESHNNTATANHLFGGSNFWLGLSKVKSSQHDHISYKGKSAPN